MCDTQVILQNGAMFFAKNSDRESSEAQVIERVAPAAGNAATTVETTYMEIPEVPNRHGLILSKPSWMWGAEMGVNDQGVVIGNEAVFTKLIQRKGQSLLGMDLLRLGLERGATAQAALGVITDLLEEYGQAGPAGFRDKGFRYDNSFIIADAENAWVLETAGQWWVAKKVKSHGAISNYLSIGSDYDLARPGLEDFATANRHWNGQGAFDFAKAFDTVFMSHMGKSHMRRELSLDCLSGQAENRDASLANMAANLRRHQSDELDFAKHGNEDVCMHGGGLTRPSQSCGSMIVRLEPGKAPQVMVTGTSAPCLSLFKPVDFDLSHPLYLEQSDESPKENLWHRNEWVHRRALFDPAFRGELRASRDNLESQMMSVFEGDVSMADANALARDWHAMWIKAAKANLPQLSMLRSYDRYWRKLNRMDGFDFSSRPSSQTRP